MNSNEFAAPSDSDMEWYLMTTYVDPTERNDADEDSERLAAMQAIWDAAPTTFPVPYDSDMEFDGSDEDTRELSDYEYDRIADNYERNWV